MILNNKLIPCSWKQLEWIDYVAIQGADSLAELIKRIAGLTDDQVNELTAQELLTIHERLTFLNEQPLPAVLIKPIDLYPLECYVNARNVIRTEPMNWPAVCQAFWPGIETNADAIISHYNAIKIAFDQLDNDFAMLNEKPDQNWIKAGVHQLEAFGDYAMVHQLAGGDILKEDAVLQIPIRQAFMHRAYKVVSSKIEHKYNKIISKTIKGNR